MGLYHNTWLIYGARITNNEMNPNLWENVEAISERDPNYYLELFNLGDGEERFLVTSSQEIESNNYTNISGLPERAASHDMLIGSANELDVEIDPPGWYILHDYS